MRLYTVLLYFLQTALHVWGENFTHHQENTQTVITSGTGRTVYTTFRYRGGVGTVVPTPPRQRTLANTVRPVPVAVITVEYSPDDG